MNQSIAQQTRYCDAKWKVIGDTELQSLGDETIRNPLESWCVSSRTR